MTDVNLTEYHRNPLDDIDTQINNNIDVATSNCKYYDLQKFKSISSNNKFSPLFCNINGLNAKCEKKKLFLICQNQILFLKVELSVKPSAYQDVNSYTHYLTITQYSEIKPVLALCWFCSPGMICFFFKLWMNLHLCLIIWNPYILN